MQTIVEQLNIFWGSITQSIVSMTGRTEIEIKFRLMIILGYLVVLILLMVIHRRLLKIEKRTHEKLVLSYDTLRYQVAKAQYENPSIQDTKGIKIVIDAEQKNYPANKDAIKEEIQSIEQKLGKQIVAENQRTTITRQTHKKKTMTIFVQVIGRTTTILTIGIYKLFR